MRLKRTGGALEGPAAKFLGDGAAEALGAAGRRARALRGRPRSRHQPGARPRASGRGARLHLVPEGRHDFLWVTDFPLFAGPGRPGRSRAVHHPFTAPHPDDVALLDSSPERARALAYDVVMNGMELGGGSIRISDPALQSTRLFDCSASTRRRRRRGSDSCSRGCAAGAPPHGGIAFGFDRIAMVLAGATSLRDVIAFPKTTAARALFEGAPSPVPTRSCGTCTSASAKGDRDLTDGRTGTRAENGAEESSTQRSPPRAPTCSPWPA